MASKIDVGDKAPDFELPGTGGKLFRLSDYVGEGKAGVILAFYPGDFTEVCTKQFCAYRDDSDRLDALGLPVLGISPQPVVSHEAWAQELGLRVPLLADERMQVAKAYGVSGWASPLAWLFERRAVTPGGWFVQRSIFVVDGTGTIRYRHANFRGNTYQSVEDLESAVAALA